MITINEIYQYVVTALNESEFAQGGVVIALLTATWQTIKYLPRIVLPRIERLLIYSTTIEQSDELYSLINEWIAINYPSKLRNTEAFLDEHYGAGYLRTIPMAEDEEDEEGKEEKLEDIVKFRQHDDYIIIRYKGNIIKINKSREKLEAADSFLTAYMGRLTIKGIFAKKQINSIIKESLKLKPKEEISLKKFTWDGSYWNKEYTLTNKSIETIFFPGKDKVLERIDLFSNSKKLYKKRGLDWYLGMLFYGPPGSGKTVFAKALAKYTKRDLYSINISSIATDGEFMRSFSRISSNSVLLLDDIDVCIPKRNKKKDRTVSLSTLLSCLDGANSKSDIIVIMTTNYIDKLDPALIRKGRIDLKHEISYPDKECIENYLQAYYDKKPKALQDLDFNKPMVEIQDICLTSETINQAINKINNQFKKNE